MADESAVAEPSVDAQLEELFGTTKETKPAAQAAAVTEGEQPPAGDKTPPAASPAESEDPLLAALDGIEEEKPAEVKPEDGKPALSEEQKAVLDVIPDPKVAVEMYNTVQNYRNFTTALEGGKFGDVETMLSEWNPDVLEGWVEHVYEKHKEAFVDRFIAEAEGKGKSPDLVKLEKEVRTLKSSLEEKKVVNAQSAEQQRTQAAFKAYNDHVEALFDQIKFNKSDRRYVIADLKTRLAEDPKTLAAIKSGNTKAVNSLFKTACREYLQRDKEVTETTTEKIAAQDKKKIPLGGGAAQTDTIPEDIRQVKKGQEDSWAQRALDILFKK